MRMIAAAIFAIVATSCAAAELTTAQFQLLTKNLNDPESARVRNLRVSTKFEGVFCGEVNWRNQQGGYGGYKGFWLDTAELQVSIDPDPSFATFYEEMGCSH
jgi:hypothetical protein